MTSIAIGKSNNDLSSVIVDPEDAFILELWKWKVNEFGYVERRTSYKKPDRKNPVGKRVFLHRQILNYQGPDTVDHIDGNPLNNSRSNLEIVSAEENNKRKVERCKQEASVGASA